MDFLINFTKLKVAIIKYNSGNVFSVKCALDRIGVDAEVTADIGALKGADKVIFPGVGNASSAMEYLQFKGLDAVIRDLKQPVLGICLGLQLLCRSTEEGNVKGLGIFDTDVKRFSNEYCKDMKIPHMGWNTIHVPSGSFISKQLDGKYAYFVHSYYASLCDSTAAVCDYITPFSAALHKDNFYATQFHPEKSGDLGEAILKSFIEL